MRTLRAFFNDALREATQGSPTYHAWMGLLTLLMCCGAWAYSVQLREGLVVTGLHDHVSWGFYISNFTFLVGVAAAAVILVMPTYVLKDHDFHSAVLIGEAMAEGLRTQFGVAKVIIRRKAFFSKPASRELLDEMANEIDAAITAVGG